MTFMCLTIRKHLVFHMNINNHSYYESEFEDQVTTR